jgi:protein TonB
MTAAFAWHATLALLFLIPHRRDVTRNQPQPERPARELIWLASAGPSDGGGGGGDERPEPAARLQRPGRDSMSVPAPPPAPQASDASREPDPIDRVIIPARPLGDALASVPGLLSAPAVQSTSLGTGTGPGAGDGAGSGLGVGDGPGVDAGRNGGIGGGDYGPGGGVTMPVAIHRESPRYSTEAMRARIEGVVVVECVVRQSGVCSDIHVIRSLDPRFGLDDEARRAAALWRFRPGTRRGEPVPVAVRLELAFSIR